MVCVRPQVNGALPEQIVIFRDGVGDGQIKMVVEHETPQLMEACRRKIPHYTPKFLVVIVQKKICARFYARVFTSLMYLVFVWLYSYRDNITGLPNIREIRT